MFYNDLSKVYEHKGLERNSLGKIKQMKQAVPKIIENYKSVISSQNLNKAFAKVDEVKKLAGDSIA